MKIFLFTQNQVLKSVIKPMAKLGLAIIVLFGINQYLLQSRQIYFRAIPTTVKELLYVLVFLGIIAFLCDFVLWHLDKYFEKGKTSIFAYLVENSILISTTTLLYSLGSEKPDWKFNITMGFVYLSALFFHDFGRFLAAKRYGFDPKMVSARWLYQHNFSIFRKKGFRRLIITDVTFEGKITYLSLFGFVSNVLGFIFFIPLILISPEGFVFFSVAYFILSCWFLLFKRHSSKLHETI